MHRYCGITYNGSPDDAYQRYSYQDLPIVNLSVHTTILSTTSRTVLSQTFENSNKTTINQCRYDFPLYDGVSVVGFTCQIGQRSIEGVVKEKNKAKEVYDYAVAKGETAGLLARGPTSDVFSTSLGNISAGEIINIQVTYIGELKYDVGSQCTKFTIPTSIAPRYGNTYAGLKEILASGRNGIEITIDIDLGSDSTIREVRSPSHPIAIKIGNISTAPTTQALQMSHASATLSQDSVDLDKDFILEIVNNIADKPKAVLETYADDPRQKALMVTLVPTVSLPLAKPEIIIIADRSGSMGGNKMITLVRALKVFLRSLPVGIYFNICSFGSRHEFLWEKSRSYGEETLAEATRHVEGFVANFGGTETLAAVQASIEARDVKQDLALILCTDGDIWQQQKLFSYLNTQVQHSTNPIRVFPLGIGDTVSSGLIEGVARAGNGFASTVGEHEKLDGKIVHMLKGALTEHIRDYTFDVKYGSNEEEEYEDGFVLVESITEGLSVTTLDDPNFAAPASDSNRTSISNNDGDGQGRYAGLPVVAIPKYLQSPQEILPLYQSSRTTVYVMISPDAPEQQPTAVVLKGTSSKGPIKYEIPVDRITEPGKTIHQLAARKAIGELEEGRGWLNHAKDADGVLLNDRFSSSSSHEAKLKPVNFEDIVEREAVRLGVKYEVGGKFCSFVAVEGGKITHQAGISHANIEEDRGYVVPQGALMAGNPIFFSGSVGSFKPLSASGSSFDRGSRGQGSLRESAAVNMSASRSRAMPLCAAAPAPASASVGARSPPPSRSIRSDAYDQYQSRRQSLGASRGVSTFSASRSDDGNESPARSKAFKIGESAAVNQDSLEQIISLQSFQGFWEFGQAVLDACGIKMTASATDSSTRVAATILAISFLERKMAGEKDTWELIVEKAKGWLDTQGVKLDEEVEKEPLKGLISQL